MKAIKQKYLINSPVKTVWQALVDPVIIDKWGGGPSKMDDKAGTKFSLWGGDIYGKNIKVIEYKTLVQDWFEGDWKEPSKVTFTLKEKNGKTELELLHENVPDNEAKDVDEGWELYYLGPLKKLLEK